MAGIFTFSEVRFYVVINSISSVVYSTDDVNRRCDH